MNKVVRTSNGGAMLRFFLHTVVQIVESNNAK
jgi:hypothetical protein